MQSKGNVVMKKLLILLPLLLCGEEGFISHYEYGEMLYENPRGVSCAQCHGASGEGRIIVKYKDAEGVQALRGADIRHDDLATMITAVRAYHKVMPRYYLTNKEVEAIYDYLSIKNRQYLEKNIEKN